MAYTASMQHSGLHSRTIVVSALAVLAALVFVVRFGLSVETLQYVALTALLGWASIEDLRSRTIPNECILAMVGNRVVYSALLAMFGRFEAGECVYYFASGLGTGAVLLLFALVFERVTGREGMGGGDVKLYAVAGLYLGVDGAAFVAFLSCMFALAAAVLTKSARGEAEGLARTLPFGPAIAASIILVALAMAH